MATLRWMGVPEKAVRMVLCGPGVSGEFKLDVGLVVYRCGGTDI